MARLSRRSASGVQGHHVPVLSGRGSGDSALTTSETEPLLRQTMDAEAIAQTSAGAAVAPATGPIASVDEQLARRVLRKIDRTIIPLLFVTYMLNFMDKTILSSAAVFGLRDDNKLKGQEYSWVSSAFYFGYLVWEYPTTLLIARLPVAKYLSANTVFWGTVVAMTAACTNFGGLVTVRVLLGVAEATITPAFMFLTSTWYTRDEMPTRIGIWFAGNSIGGLLSSLIAFGIGHIDDHVGPWRWMFIVLGIATFLWAIPMYYFLPDTISKAKFLTAEERQVAVERVVIAGTGNTENSHWRVDQLRECLVDPKTWLIFSIELLSQMPNGGTQSFTNIVIKSFGFTSLQSTLINIPYSILAASIIAGTGWLAGRYRTLNCLLICMVVAPCVTGAAIIYRREQVSRGVQLFAYFLLSSGPAAMPLNMSLVQSNYRGVTKKMTITAMLFLAYCAGNIAGPHFFRKEEDPTYQTAFQAIMVCYALVITLALALRFYLQWTNTRRTKDEGFEGSAGTSGAVAQGKISDAQARGAEITEATTELQLRPEDFEDVTDWNTVGFRYRL